MKSWRLMEGVNVVLDIEMANYSFIGGCFYLENNDFYENCNTYDKILILTKSNAFKDVISMLLCPDINKSNLIIKIWQC